MHELGYVSIRESHRKRGISKEIAGALLSAVQDQPLWATTSNRWMEKTLTGSGFSQHGEGWQGNDGDTLHLWIKNQPGEKAGEG